MSLLSPQNPIYVSFGNLEILPPCVIKTTAILDIETKDHYWLTVFAQDHGVVPLFSSVENTQTGDKIAGLRNYYFLKEKRKTAASSQSLLDDIEDEEPFWYNPCPEEIPVAKRNLLRKPSGTCDEETIANRVLDCLAQTAYTATSVKEEMCQQYFQQDFELTEKLCADQKLHGVDVTGFGEIIRKKNLITLRILRLSHQILQKIAAYIDFFKNDSIFKTQIQPLRNLLCEIKRALGKYGESPENVTRAIIPQELKLDRTSYSKRVNQFVVLRDYMLVMEIIRNGLEKKCPERTNPIYIEVLNENDNVPLSELPVYYPVIQEDSPAGKTVLQIKATDRDKDPNQKISYKIAAGNPEGFFTINSHTGVITTTARKLDRETQDEHILESFPPNADFQDDSDNFLYTQHQIAQLHSLEPQAKEYDGNSAKRGYLANKFFVSDDQLPWTEARSACLSKGMILTAPRNMLQMHKLRDYLRINDLIPTDSFSGFWVGDQSASDPNEFISTFNGEVINDELWVVRKINLPLGQKCAEFQKLKYITRTLDLICFNRRRYICEQTENEEALKNKSGSQLASNSTQEAHHEINKISAEVNGTQSFNVTSSSVNMRTNTSINITSTTTEQPTTSTDYADYAEAMYQNGWQEPIHYFDDPFADHDYY
ncbi:hypothetical protein HUJ05_011662 [Dendroctonus ponderosae]|nr:hypothetical protein HUJ05_011662 [Dendroctonus ponderosae]